MRITVFIDNNVWDFLSANNLKLADELPATEFEICMTREGEIETMPMPAAMRDFVAETIAASRVKTDAYFGFADPNLSASEQRVAGFDRGRFASNEELQFIDDQKHRVKPTTRPKALLAKNEGDLALAARSLHSVVLTAERAGKNGPLKTARDRGGRILYLSDYEASGKSLADFIQSSISPGTDEPL